MRKTFLRTLLIMGVVQFVVTRRMAGQVIEEGRAERMWMLFPVNLLLNAAFVTLVIAASGGMLKALRRS
jgi:hypothetical protein